MFYSPIICKAWLKKPVRTQTTSHLNYNSIIINIFFRRRAGISSQPATASASAESDSPPSHWARIPDGEDYLRVKLDTISEEYKKTEKKFLETMEGRHNIFKIERVQNPELWTVYIQ